MQNELLRQILNYSSLLCSLQENRPLSKAFFTRMIEIEKEHVCITASVRHIWKLLHAPKCETIESVWIGFTDTDTLLHQKTNLWDRLWTCLFFQESTKMNYLRDYYERALQEFGTSDEGTYIKCLPKRTQVKRKCGVR